MTSCDREKLSTPAGQVKDNLACIGVKLEPTRIARLDTVSKIDLGFPMDMLAKDMPRSLSSGGMRDLFDV